MRSRDFSFRCSSKAATPSAQTRRCPGSKTTLTAKTRGVRVQLRGQLNLARGEIAQSEGLLDLPHVIQPGLLPLGVALHTRRVRDPQLPGDHVHNLSRHRQRISQETAQIPDGHQLQRKPEPRPRAPMTINAPLVRIVEENIFSSATGAGGPLKRP
jgi:hypothetical protein